MGRYGGKSWHPSRPYDKVSTKEGETSVVINKEINEYQWNNQIIKWIIKKNKQSESEIVPWQQVTVRYHEMELVHNNEYKIYRMYIK